MTRVMFLALCVIVAGCDEPETRLRVNVAPSAQGQLAAIRTAVEALNGWTGEESFEWRLAGSEEAVEGEITVRGGEDIQGRVATSSGGIVAGATGGGYSKVILLKLDAWAMTRVVAHELGHAAGLAHIDDPWNLMNPTVPIQGDADAWELTEEQVEVMR